METNKQLEQEMPKTNFLHREVNIRINNKEIKGILGIINNKNNNIRFEKIETIGILEILEIINNKDNKGKFERTDKIENK